MRHLPETKLIVGFYGTLGARRSRTPGFTAALAGTQKFLGVWVQGHSSRIMLIDSPSRHLRKGKIVDPEVAPVFTWVSLMISQGEIEGSHWARTPYDAHFGTAPDRNNDSFQKIWKIVWLTRRHATTKRRSPEERTQASQ